MIRVALRLIYLVFSMLLSWMILLARPQQAKEIEILVLRHQLALLQRRTPRPRMSWADQARTAALARLLPTRRCLGLLVTPPPSCAGTGDSSPAAGPPTHAARSTTTPLRPLCPRRPPWPRRTPRGATDASTANSPASATRSAPPPSGRP